MPSQIIVETRTEGEDKWSADAGFADFDDCYSHVVNLSKKEGRIVRLIIPGGFKLSPDQIEALDRLGIQWNS